MTLKRCWTLECTGKKAECMKRIPPSWQLYFTHEQVDQQALMGPIYFFSQGELEMQISNPSFPTNCNFLLITFVMLKLCTALTSDLKTFQ